MRAAAPVFEEVQQPIPQNRGKVSSVVKFIFPAGAGEG